MCELDTLSERGKEFQHNFNPNIIIISNHPGLKCISDVQQWLNGLRLKPELLICCFLQSGLDIQNVLNGYEVASELNSEGCEVFEYSIIQG
jgi:hypothetical protein